jgi:hypothetical protein
LGHGYRDLTGRTRSGERVRQTLRETFVETLEEDFSATIKALGRRIQDVGLERGTHGPEIHIRYLDAKDGQIHDSDMPILAGGSPEYEDPDSIASTIVINFIEP